MGCIYSYRKGEVDPKQEKDEEHYPCHDIDKKSNEVHSVADNQGESGKQVSVDCETAMKLLCKKKSQPWRLASCFLSLGRRRLLNDTNDTWLLEANEREGCKLGCDAENPDISSVNSSFRFSFGSQLDSEVCSNSNNNSGRTILMLNLDKNNDDDAESRKSEFHWARIQSLERHILPATEGLVRFEYEEIRAATSAFSQDRVLGRGAHSCVYKGRLRMGRLIAVKRLEKNDKEAGKAFCRELHIASGLKNRHVVPLLGFCVDPTGLFLVYKFISGGSLEYHLHEKKGKGSLSWSARLQVAIGIAKAVDYLHHGTEKCVVHRDIKPSNILLSSRKKAKLCDFGLATWTLGASVPFLCKTVKGTFGYLAPEYFQHGKVSEKTDIYSFGVVLLELLTGRKPIETKRQLGDENLVIWARPLLYGGKAEELLDPQLKACFKSKCKEVNRMMMAAAVCLHPTESWRPCMSQVVRILQGQEDAKLFQYARLTMLNVDADYSTNNGREDMKALKGHLALAMVGVDENGGDDEKLDR